MHLSAPIMFLLHLMVPGEQSEPTALFLHWVLGNGTFLKPETQEESHVKFLILSFPIQKAVCWGKKKKRKKKGKEKEWFLCLFSTEYMFSICLADTSLTCITYIYLFDFWWFLKNILSNIKIFLGRSKNIHQPSSWKCNKHMCLSHFA